MKTLKDAENNLTTYVYDGHDRLSQTQYPSATKGAGTSNTADFEQLTYENTASNTRTSATVASRRNRANQTTSFSYDNLGRVTLKNLPAGEQDVSYGYDNLGRLTAASRTGIALSFTYDALSRQLTEVGPLGTVASEYDIAGRRTKLTYPGSGLYVEHDYLVTGEVAKIRENGATSGVGVLASYGHDNLGNRTSITFGNGVVQSFGFDPVSRLQSLTNQMAGTANDLSATLRGTPSQAEKEKEKPKYCEKIGYRIANKVDQIAGYAQAAALGHGLMMQTEPYAIVRDAAGKAAIRTYKELAYVRLGANVVMGLYGDYRGAVVSVIGEVLGRAAGVDKLGEVVGGATGDVITN